MTISRTFAFLSIANLAAATTLNALRGGADRELSTGSAMRHACSLKPVCNALGLTGDCCPTVEGVFLDCCDDDAGSPPFAAPGTAPSAHKPTPSPPTSAKKPSIPAPSVASAPTASAMTPSEGPSSVPSKTPNSAVPNLTPKSGLVHSNSCSAHKACVALGLSDSCCPTAVGVVLDCCN